MKNIPQNIRTQLAAKVEQTFGVEATARVLTIRTDAQLRTMVKRASRATVRAMEKRDALERQLEQQLAEAKSAVNAAVKYQTLLSDALYAVENPDEAQP